MELIVDENIPVKLIFWLNQRGHTTHTVTKGSSDEIVAALAKERKSILLTHDRHFSNTLRFPPNDFTGIVRIKIHPSYIEDIIFSMEKLFEIFRKPEDFKSKLIILEKEGFFKLRE